MIVFDTKRTISQSVNIDNANIGYCIILTKFFKKNIFGQANPAPTVAQSTIAYARADRRVCPYNRRLLHDLGGRTLFSISFRNFVARLSYTQEGQFIYAYKCNPQN